jgi:phosphoribosylformylglycinamidine synthase subunit PurS
MIKVRIYITLKEAVADPQGIAIKHALESLHFKEIQKVRIGKMITLTYNRKSKKKAIEDIDKMCKKILANPVTEEYRYEIENLKKCHYKTL